MVFLTIMLLSMFPEDTLETQAGATLFAFFSALLLMANGATDSVWTGTHPSATVSLCSPPWAGHTC